MTSTVDRIGLPWIWSIVILLFLIVTFLVIRESLILTIDVPLKSRPRFNVCPIPSSVLSTLPKMVASWSHSMGYDYEYVDTDTDLGALSELVTAKMSRYFRVKSLIIKHVYNVKCTHSFLAEFELSLPKYKHGLFLINLDPSGKPLTVFTSQRKKDTFSIPQYMLAFTSLATPGKEFCSIKAQGSKFMYGIITPHSTLHY